MTTISSTINGYVLLDVNHGATNPVSVTGTITDPLNDHNIALQGVGSTVWNITNQRTIQATGSLAAGVSLEVGGILNNSGFIQGTNDGVANIDVLTNSGTIVGTNSFGVDGGSGGTITNTACG